jgi:hypothetical protein
MPERCNGMGTGRVIPLSVHRCPACGRPMRLDSVVPRFGSFPELRSFACKACGVTYTEAAKDDDMPDSLTFTPR